MNLKIKKMRQQIGKSELVRGPNRKKKKGQRSSEKNQGPNKENGEKAPTINNNQRPNKASRTLEGMEKVIFRVSALSNTNFLFFQKRKM